jgi:hypothetical protein
MFISHEARQERLAYGAGRCGISSVLNSPRHSGQHRDLTLSYLRALVSTHADLARKLEELEMKYDAQFRVVFDAIRQLMTPPDPPKKRIGFEVKEARAKYGKGGMRG